MKRFYLYVVLAAVIFSTMEIAGKTIAEDINPFQLNFIRFLLGGLILLPTSLWTIKNRNIKLNQNDYLYFLLTGFLGIVVSMSLFQFAILYTMASTVAVIFSANPIFTAPIACLLINERLTKKVVVSLLVSVFGLLLILNPLGIHTDMKGIVLVILSTVTFSMFSVISKMRVERYGSITINCFSFLAGDAILLGLMLVSHLPLVERLQAGTVNKLLIDIPIFSGINYSNLGILLYLGVVVSGLGFLFYFMAMEESCATNASVVFFIKTALAPLLCLWILHEHLFLHTVTGMALILVGAYIMVFKNNGNRQMQLNS